MNKYKELYSPLRIGRVLLKNRIVLSPVSTRYTDVTGEINDAYFQYITARARGGAGLIVTEAVSPDSSFAHEISPANLDTNSRQARWQEVADTVHMYGCKILIQLDAGGADYAEDPIEQGIETCKGWTKEDIDTMEANFVRAAGYSQVAGVDGIEIAVTGGYVYNQFLTPLTNKRTDEYNGSPENRVRIVTETIKKVREAVGPNFLIGVRLPCMDCVEGGLTLEDCGIMAKFCQDAGANLINLGVGICYDDEYFETEYRPDGDRVEWAETIKKYVDIPVIANGKIKTAELANSVIKEGKADMVSFGRQFIADPNWPIKARLGRESEIRYCLSCNECIGNEILRDSTLRCTVNPYLGKGMLIDEDDIPMAAVKKTVVVVGAGPAGIMAAVTASRRGHDVTLIEKNTMVNGQMRLAAIPNNKECLAHFCNYMENLLKKSGVKVELGKEATAEYIIGKNPDTVLLATGSVPVTIPVEGAQFAVQSWDVLDSRCEGMDGKKVAVIGAGLVGCELAEMLAVNKKCTVTMIEMKADVGDGMEYYHSQIIPRELKKNGVSIYTSATVKKITEDSVVYADSNGNEKTADADVVIMATGQRPNGAALEEELLDAGVMSRVIGDASRTGKIHDALRAGLICGYQA